MYTFKIITLGSISKQKTCLNYLLCNTATDSIRVFAVSTKYHFNGSLQYHKMYNPALHILINNGHLQQLNNDLYLFYYTEILVMRLMLPHYLTIFGNSIGENNNKISKPSLACYRSIIVKLAFWYFYNSNFDNI